MTIASILSAKGGAVATIVPTASVREALKQFQALGIGAVLVLNEAKTPIGVLSERDVVRGIVTQGDSVLDARAEEVMSSPVITVTPAHTVGEAMSLMTSRRIRHLPVMESGQLVGIVSIGDLVKARIEAVEHEAEALKSYIATG